MCCHIIRGNLKILTIFTIQMLLRILFLISHNVFIMRKAKDISLGSQNSSAFESLVGFCFMNTVKNVIALSLLDNVKPKV